jgi:hypothetical protein
LADGEQVFVAEDMIRHKQTEAALKTGTRAKDATPKCRQPDGKRVYENAIERRR